MQLSAPFGYYLAMSRGAAEALGKRAAGDLLVAETLGPCSDIDDAVIGFYAQQIVEKSVKVALALRDVDFPMMAHDLDLLLTLAADNDIEIPAELTGAAWLTAWGTTYENGEASPGTLDRQEVIAVGRAAVSWCDDLTSETGPNREGENPPPPPPPVPGLGRPETRGLC